MVPFRVLDAPSLRDDYYCSLLAYSQTINCLAVALGTHVYLWSETRTSDTPGNVNQGFAHATSLSFSSIVGAQAILAIGRADGRVTLWSPLDEEARFDSQQPNPISCVCFRPNTVKRSSARDPCITVSTEELLIGDELGHVYLYAVEWPTAVERDLFDFNGSMVLLARIAIHTQQICGLAWSREGDFFATGGNDNNCYLFKTKRIVDNAAQGTNHQSVTINPDGTRRWTVVPGSPSVPHHTSPFLASHTFTLSAAVKAIAFCPWQRGLLALGGGSNDRCIHFYHTVSGACLATIDCAAQVTSLIWSEKKREICATFGFAQPEHPYRVAVFTWPGCECVGRVPWWDEHRALWAVAYPGGPRMGREVGSVRGRDSRRGSGRGGMRRLYDDDGDHEHADDDELALGVEQGGGVRSRVGREGCIVVATSDASIKFHEVWSDERRGRRDGIGGLLGGSDILESWHGVDKEGGEVIR